MPARLGRTALILLTAGPALGGCAGSPPPPPSQGVAAQVSITNGFVFEPRVVHIQPGQTVEWRNASLVTHDVTLDPGKAPRSGYVILPPGTEPFASGDVGRGATYRMTFPHPGIYSYTDTHYSWLGMGGAVEVRSQPVSDPRPTNPQPGEG